MKKNFHNNKNLFLFLICLIFCCFQMGCNKNFRDFKRSHRHDQLLVYYKDGTDSIRTAYKNLIRRRYQFTDTTCVCDINLELWTGDNIEELLRNTPSVIKTETARSSSKTTVSGDDTIYLSLNLRFDRPGVSKEPKLEKMTHSAVKGNGKISVRLAILDTGLDTAYFESSLYNSFLVKGNLVDACPQENHATFAGWNILNNSSNFYDDHIGKHGTTITGLALGESKKNTLKILPVKTHDKTGTGFMFHLLCGMKYAQHARANLINASWGGEGDRNPMFIHILNQLQSDSILFVAAAGNEGRDINRYKVYPARYSKPDTGNVITVTTSDEREHCDNSNYSTKYVDVGVSGESIICTFRSPFQVVGTTSIQITGTSFATAVFSGKLSDRYPFPSMGVSSFKSNLISGIPGSISGVNDVRTHKRYKQQ